MKGYLKLLSVFIAMLLACPLLTGCDKTMLNSNTKSATEHTAKINAIFRVKKSKKY